MCELGETGAREKEVEEEEEEEEEGWQIAEKN